MIRHTPSLERYLAAISLLFGLLFLAEPVLGEQDRLRNEVRQFHTFLQSHPKVASELQNNPKLVNSKKYLDKHDDLKTFLKRHPRVKQEIVNHPARVFGNYYREDHGRSPHR